MSIPFPGLCTDHQRQQRTETGNVCGNEDPLNEKTMTIDPEFAIARELATLAPRQAEEWECFT